MNLSIKKRMTLVMGSIIVLFITMMWFSVNGNNQIQALSIEKTQAVMLEGQKEKIRIATHAIAVSLGHAIENIHGINEKKAVLGKLIDDIRFEKDESGYFFIYQDTTNVVLPPKKEIQGKDLKNTKDANGVYLVKELRDLSKKGGGFLTWIWPKPGAGDVPKLGYAEMIPGTDFWIGTGVYLDNIDAYKQRMTQDIHGKVKSSTIRMLIFSGIIAACIIVLCLFIIVGIVKKLGLIIDNVKDIAQGEGDLTKRVYISSKDELGELAGWLNVFLEKLQGIIKKLADNSEHVGDASNTLAAIAAQMSSNAEDTSRRAGHVATASEEMSVNMNSVASAMEQSSSNASMVASAAEEMNATINEITVTAESARNITEKAGEKVSEASGSMAGLTQAAKDIGKVTDTINDISEQINLLALNATIEAARAGDAGRGFAVVATEIKALASQTAAATADIQSKINNVQTTSDGTGRVISEITDVINDVKEMVATIATAVTEQSSATREIADNVEQLSLGIQDVNENVSRSNQVAGEMAQDITEVSKASGDVVSGSSKVELNAGELKKMAADLKQIVDTFII